MKQSRIVMIPEHPGKCRWCGCSEFDPCPAGCGWANVRQTLCTECVELDKLVGTVSGRQELARRLQDEQQYDNAPTPRSPICPKFQGRKLRCARCLWPKRIHPVKNPHFQRIARNAQRARRRAERKR